MDSIEAGVIIRMRAAMTEEGIGPSDPDGYGMNGSWTEPKVAAVMREAYRMGGHQFTTRALYAAGFVDEDGTPL